MRSNRYAMILWDLENWLFFPMKPLRYEVQVAFSLRIQSDVERYLKHHGISIPVGCKRAFARDDLVDNEAMRVVEEQTGYMVRLTDKHRKNAADKVLIDVGYGLLKDHLFTSNVVLLTGDTDFLGFASVLEEEGFTVWIVMPGKEEKSMRRSVRAYRRVASHVLSLADIKAYLRQVET